jgi:uncharacterized protein YecE (DUF72 family)
LPPTLKADPVALEDTLGRFPRKVRVAVEFRHVSWFTAEVRAILTKHNAALCMADRLGKPVTELWRTSDWGFIRFHEGLAMPPPCYPKRQLEKWVERLAGQWTPEEDLFAYFNNDPRACALRDARVFAELAEEAGLRPTRVAPASDVRVDRSPEEDDDEPGGR